MGGVFPGANDLQEFWDNISNARDLSREPPPGRWLLSLADAYDSRGPQPDKVYSKHACFVDGMVLDKTGLDIDDRLLEQLDPMFHLLLQAGGQAWRDGVTDNIDKQRVGVIIGNIALPTDSSSALADELLGPVMDQLVLGDSGRVKHINRLNRYVAGLPAGILCRALGLGAGSYTLDAACASSLYAVKFAVDELQAGRTDAMLAGGLSRPDSLYTQMGFSSLHAISASGRCAPFDHKADGLVVGEGCGMFLLKRLDDALAAGDRIHALITGIGLSNDIGGNLMSPDTEGQLRAMRLAYHQAGWQPADVDLIECHGTGTPVGDVVEFNSLNNLWQEQENKKKCVIGSVKSNIGHLLTAAGSAGLIKVLLAMRYEQLPPTANFERANSNIDLLNSPFTVLETADQWQQRDLNTPRRAAVSAFGFGGINAHLLLEQWQDAGGEQSTPSITTNPETDQIAIVGMSAAFGPWQSLADFQRRVFGGDEAVPSRALDKWWGIGNKHGIRGYSMDTVEVPVGRFRIPPNELRDMLPQQLLMLQVAANAIADAGLEIMDSMPDAGVYIGIGLDLNTTNFHVRWSLLHRVSDWARQLGLKLDPDQLQQWTTALRDAFCPPLTANRTMGALGGIVASRVARAFNVGGPSFTLSAEETSGLRSLEAGVRALRRHEINTAIVGAVDLASDVRATLGQAEARPWSANGECRPFDINADGAIVGDGAAAVILKRFEDAQRNGDRIYALIKGIGSAVGGQPDAVVPPDSTYRRAVANALNDAAAASDLISLIETHGTGYPEEDQMEADSLAGILAQRQSGIPCAIGSVKADIGHSGAASAMAGIVRMALALHQHIIPPLRNLQQLHPQLTNIGSGLFAPRQKQYWLRNKAEGPRLALVNAMSVDGNCVSAVLADAAGPPVETGSFPADPSLPVLFSITGDAPADLLHKLARLSRASKAMTLPQLRRLAGDWYRDQRDNSEKLAISLLATNASEFAGLIDRANTCVAQGIECTDGSVYYTPAPMGPDAEIAFVFPGSGNHFHGMGRQAAACWPQLVDRLDRENDRLADQFAMTRFWSQADDETLSHQDVIFGQVWLGTMMSDVVAAFGARPSAIIGYSLGETAGLFASRAWTDRDLMLQRIRESNLFIDELAGACLAARRTWQLDSDQTVDWLVGVVDCPAALVKEKLQGLSRAYLLIINTDNESVVGGNRAAVMALVRELGCHFHPVTGVTTVHCEVVQPVAEAYRELHLFDTNPPEGVRFYSGILGRAYDLNRDSAADSITGQALHYFDYPEVIKSAYRDGVRIFMEMGPGATCTRMIDQILGDKKHVARALCIKGQSEPLLIIRLLAQLNTERVPLYLDSLYEDLQATSDKLQDKQENIISVQVGKADLNQLQAISHKLQAEHSPKNTEPAEVVQLHDKPVQSGLMQQLIEQAGRTETARAEAQEVFLRVANGISQSLAQAWSATTLLQSSQGAIPLPAVFIDNNQSGPVQDHQVPVFDRDMCMEFAKGSIAAVLGERFLTVDSFPTRVRLPDEPLMLVDRIMAVEGELCSMTSGRVVTEHDVLADAWYLDGGRIPTCIAVEAGQADLFLSGYLGIDLHTAGLAMYRLLDAEVTFHGPLPRPGQTIRYDIHIDNFFRQGDTWLFRFRFEGTVDGQMLISMRNGCAGFFTSAELQAGQGIVLTSLEKRTMQGKRPANWAAPVDMQATSYDDSQIEALRMGRLADCFGPAFAGLQLGNPAGLPSGRMTLVHRVLKLDPNGGRFGIGSITGEADIHPGDWFLTCHFVDDRVMPGTLMYECCLHTLRIYLLRMGWVGEADEIVYEPLPGISSKLKCRGQVIESTSKVQYEITLKEYGYMAEGTPYVIADALMYADGRAIVQMTDMSLLLSGLTKKRIDELWHNTTSTPTRTALFDHESILAFATGKPSDAFGERYQVFDAKRVIARLPGPPYQFLDRIVTIENCNQWQLQAGGIIEAEYDVPPDAWYFDSDRQPYMPFAVLLETALQPCGWLAAYLGSALTSDIDLRFRNLGGKARAFLPVSAGTGTIVTRVKITNVSSSGGMIIQHFDYDLHCPTGRIYQGNTYFGFFTGEALANQIGLREAQLYQPDTVQSGHGTQFNYPAQPPYPDQMLRMIDRITLFDPEGGPAGLGFISGTADVRPDAWFFKAHFYQDPVWPGSLGLESFLQLLKVVACHHWGDDPQTVVFMPMIAAHEHTWTYRGQIIPTDNLVTVQAVIKEINNMEKILRADGFLSVDGRIIYQMKDFTLKLYNRDAL